MADTRTTAFTLRRLCLLLLFVSLLVLAPSCNSRPSDPPPPQPQGARQISEPSGGARPVAEEAEDGQWVMPAKNYASTRFSGLDEINTGNVKDLKVAWTFSTGVNRGQEAAPIVVGDTMYLVTPYPNLLYALDLKNPGGVRHLIEYHVVTKGMCWGGIAGEEPVRLSEGDVIVFPHGDAHVISSAPGMRGAPDMDVYQQRQLPFMLTLGEGGPEKVNLVCGFLGCDARPFNPLLETLPRVLHVSGDQGKGGGWLGQFIRFTLSEAEDKRPGGDCVLAKVSELMFIEVVRRHLETLPPEQTGWLAGLRDGHVGRALALLHNDPAHPWTLEELAHEVGLSRSAFAERFTHLVGQPPMQYLAQWRMQVAAGLLSRGDANVAEVALEVGYDSEAAFSRAFKRLVGTPPAAWRRRQSRP